MGKFMKIPFYFPLIGLMVGFVLLLIAANVPNMALLITGIILIHLAGWILAINFFLCGVVSFSSVLITK